MSWGPPQVRYSLYPEPAYIAPPARRGLRFSPEELKHILLACGALILAFTLAFLDVLRFGRLPPATTIARTALGAAVAVLTGFFLHEMAHKVLAQRYGAWAEFRSSRNGLVFAIVTAIIGIVFAAPGAVYIAGRLSKVENGKVSLVGPMTNLAIAGGFLVAWIGVRGVASLGPAWSYLEGVLYLTAYINSWLAIFNLIPVPPLDGSKVLAWHPAIWVAAIAASGLLFAGAFFIGI